MYENGSIQHSNIRTNELVLKSAKKLICDLHAQYPLPIILLGVNSCLNQLNNTFENVRKYCWGRIQRSTIRTYELVLKSAKLVLKNTFEIFIHNIPYH